MLEVRLQRKEDAKQRNDQLRSNGRRARCIVAVTGTNPELQTEPDAEKTDRVPEQPRGERVVGVNDSQRREERCQERRPRHADSGPAARIERNSSEHTPAGFEKSLKVATLTYGIDRIGDTERCEEK